MSSPRPSSRIDHIVETSDNETIIYFESEEKSAASTPVRGTTTSLLVDNQHDTYLNELNENDFDSTSSLLLSDKTPEEATESWAAWGWRQLKKLPLAAISLVAAAPSAINALAAPTSAEPSDIVDGLWWRALSPVKIMHSLANAASSLGINTIMNLFFFPSAFNNFWANIKTFRQTPVGNIAYILLGIGGAIGASAVAYAAFHFFPGSFLGELLAGSAALLNFTVLVATRYVGAVNFIKRIKNYFDPTITLQKELVDLLDHVKPEYKNEVKQKFLTSTQLALNGFTAQKAEDVDKIIENLVQALEDYAKDHPYLFTDPTKLELFTNGLLTLFDLSFAAIMLVVPTLTFMQKGVDGLGTLKGFISGDDLSDWSPWAQRGLGLLPGLSSGFLYSSSAYDLRSTFVDTAKHLCSHPKQIPSAILLLGANILAASSLENIAKGIVKKENITFVSKAHSSKELVQAFIWTNALGGFSTNGKSTFAKAFLGEEPLAEKMKSLDGFTKHIRNHGAHPISDDCANKLRAHSLFKKNTDFQTNEKNRLLKKLTSFSYNN